MKKTWNELIMEFHKFYRGLFISIYIVIAKISYSYELSIDDKTKKVLLGAINARMDKKKFAPLTPIEKWPKIINKPIHKKNIKEADTLSKFIFAINRAFADFGVSHLRLTANVLKTSDILKDTGELELAKKYQQLEDKRSNIKSSYPYITPTCNPGVFLAKLSHINGMIVKDLRTGFPAQIAGLMVGDIILSADGMQLNSNWDLGGYQGEHKLLKVIRKNELHEIKLKLFYKYHPQKDPIEFKWLNHPVSNKKIPYLKLNHLRRISYTTNENNKERVWNKPHEQIKEIIEKIGYEQPNKLIIDVRDNSGGSLEYTSFLVKSLSNTWNTVTVYAYGNKQHIRWYGTPKEIYWDTLNTSTHATTSLHASIKKREPSFNENNPLTYPKILKMVPKYKEITYSPELINSHFNQKLFIRHPYTMPKPIVLCNGFSKSCAEVFTEMMKQEGATVMGSETRGEVVVLNNPILATYTTSEAFAGIVNDEYLPSFKTSFIHEQSGKKQNAKISGKGDSIIISLMYPKKTFVFGDNRKKTAYILEGAGVKPNHKTASFEKSVISDDPLLERALSVF